MSSMTHCSLYSENEFKMTSCEYEVKVVSLNVHEL